MKLTLKYYKSVVMGFFQGAKERVRNSRGKRAISVRAIAVLLYTEKGNLKTFDMPGRNLELEEV